MKTCFTCFKKSSTGSRNSFSLIELLHTRRLELEGSDGLTALIELIGQLVIDRDGIEVNDIARSLLDNLACLLHLGEGLQAQEVHLDKTGGLDDMAVVLRYPAR